MEKITRNKVDRTVYMLPGYFILEGKFLAFENSRFSTLFARKFLTILSKSVGLRVLDEHF